MRKPDSLSQCYDVIYTLGGKLNRRRVQAIMDNYNELTQPDDQPTEIKQIVYDGSEKLGAWVYCDPGIGEFDWVYIVAGDEVNRQMVALAADKGV